jgi:membrane-associated phospholipid phosphatase
VYVIRGRVVGVGVAVVLAAARAAHADPAATDQSARDRELDVALTVVMGAGYLTAEFGFHKQLSPTSCRWCAPDAFDGAMRDALVWHDTSAANTLSNATGYVIAPIAATGLVAVAGLDSGGSWGRAFDDIAPVVQSAIFVSLLQHVTKLAAARQRPFVHFAAPGPRVPTEEDNVSFWSGHTSLGFSLAVSAGEVASARGYALAPAIWATGLSLATVTGYLRIAADKHYTTDVLMGAAMGAVVGYAWPRLVHGHLFRANVDVVPAARGLALAGRF